jgi:ESCRT-I complex subunit VPS28
MKTPMHQSIYESLSEIYSIIPTLEVIEVSFLKDFVTDKEKYTSTSLRLINQYHMILATFIEDGEPKLSLLKQLIDSNNVKLSIPDLDNFLPCLVEKFHINCPLAVKRLQLGIPATIQHLTTKVESSSHPSNNTHGGSSATSSRLVAQITGNFITCMDAVKLNYNTKQQLHPLLSELVVNLNDLVEASPDHNSIDFKGKSKLVSWLIKLNNATESISEEECNTFLNDLDVAYKGFFTTLE